MTSPSKGNEVHIIRNTITRRWQKSKVSCQEQVMMGKGLIYVG